MLLAVYNPLYPFYLQILVRLEITKFIYWIATNQAVFSWGPAICLLCAMCCSCYNTFHLFNPFTTPWTRYYTHFKHEETAAQIGWPSFHPWCMYMAKADLSWMLSQWPLLPFSLGNRGAYSSPSWARRSLWSSAFVSRRVCMWDTKFANFVHFLGQRRK